MTTTAPCQPVSEHGDTSRGILGVWLGHGPLGGSANPSGCPTESGSWVGAGMHRSPRGAAGSTSQQGASDGAPRTSRVSKSFREILLNMHCHPEIRVINAVICIIHTNAIYTGAALAPSGLLGAGAELVGRAQPGLVNLTPTAAPSICWGDTGLWYLRSWSPDLQERRPPLGVLLDPHLAACLGKASRQPRHRQVAEACPQPQRSKSQITVLPRGRLPSTL